MTPLDRFRLDGRVAIVTGASRGIGAASAAALTDVGADVEREQLMIQATPMRQAASSTWRRTRRTA